MLLLLLQNVASSVDETRQAILEAVSSGVIHLVPTRDDELGRGLLGSIDLQC